MKFYVKTIETVIREYNIEAETIDQAENLALEGSASPYKNSLTDGVDVIHAEAIK